MNSKLRETELSLWRIFATCVLLLSLGGCSWLGGLFGDEEEVLEPAPLLDFQSETKVKRAWSASVGSGQGKKYNKLNPALYGDFIYAAGEDGVVAAFSAESGRKIWRQKLGESLSGGVGVSEGLVLLGTPDGEVIALTRSEGRYVWRATVTSEVLAAPASDDSVVAVQTFDGRLYGLDADNGAELWRYDSSLPVLTIRGTAAPQIEAGQVYAAFASGKIVALDVTTGTLLWEARLAIPQGQSEIERIVDIDGKPLMLGGSIYAASYQGRVGGIQRSTGRPTWLREASSYGRVAEGFGNLYVSEAGGEVIALDLESGTPKWQQPELLLRREPGSPVAFSSWVAIADLEGYIHLLSQVDGRQVGRIRADSSGVRAEMLARGNLLYVYGNGGKLTAYTVTAR